MEYCGSLKVFSSPVRLLFIFFYIVGVIFSDSITHAQVLAEPKSVLLNVGDRTDIVCKYGHVLNYCRIEIPGERVLNLSPEWNKTPGFNYFGTGLQSGQCGVTIEHVKAANNGLVKCSLGVEGEEHQETIELIVAMRPQQPIIELISKPNRDGYFEEGQLFEAHCIVRDGRPAANITWYIDEYLADKRVDQLEVIENPGDQNTIVSTTVQKISWHLGPEDNGRKLICRSHHPTDRESLPPQVGAYVLLVRFKPIKQREQLVYGLYLGQTAIVNISLRANPAPVVEWTVDGVVIPQGRQEGRFAVYEPQYLGQDFYNVTLAIAGLTLEDTTKAYNLRASNALGSTDYQVRISSSSTPPSELGIGAIVGIVVAAAILIVIVLLVVVAYTTGRWCFAGATLNTDINPDSEAQINPHHNEELDGQEFNNAENAADGTQPLSDATPPVTDKLESQKKADIRSSALVKPSTNAPGVGDPANVDNAINTNGHQNGNAHKTNTSV